MNNKKKEIFIIVDGSSYLYRAYYALPHLKNKNGQHTGAIFGVTNMINKLLNDYTPKYLSIVFDARGKNFRHELFSEYKANRKSMPVELSEQVEPILEFIKHMGINLIQYPNVEADDVIASLVNTHSENSKIMISSGDKDLAQLVNKNVILINSLDGKELDENGVVSKFGVHPSQIKDYLTLVGDTSDNIPGVPKIGPKTAVTLLKEYKSLDNILKEKENLKDTIRKNIESVSKIIEVSQKLISLKSDLDIEKDISKFTIQSSDTKLLSDFFDYYGLKKISKDMGIAKEKKVSAGNQYSNILTLGDLNTLLEKCNKNKSFSFDTETDSVDPIDANLVGVSFGISEHEAYYIPVNHKSLNSEIDVDILIKKLRDLFSNEKLTVIGQNIKYDINVLSKYDVKFKCSIEDTLIMSYINDSTGKHDLDSLADKHLGIQTIKYTDLVGTGSKQKLLSDLESEEVYKYACEDADITLQLHNIFKDKLNNLKSQKTLYQDIELPLVKILSIMELNGVKIDQKKLSTLSQKITSNIEITEKKIYKIVGNEFNISSPKQLQEIFYNQMNLPVLKKTPKGQPSTSEDVMIDLSEQHELPRLVLEFRNLSKLKNTYTDKLNQNVNKRTERLHTSYNQTVTITGRLSSSNPNLQNIPIKTQNGRDIRKAFVAEKGFVIISADYSQIELRVMAHLSKDKSLLHSFKNDEDIHSATAREIFSINGEPNSEQRRVAKTINFGLIYGISSFGLAKQLRIDNSEAKDFIEKYFNKYSGVKDFMEDIKVKAKKEGYVTTMSGRRIFLPNITHSNFQVRSAAERTAINAPIQGTAADILKVAMIEINDWIESQDDNIKMLMQVHDELVFETKKNYVEEAKSIIDDLMSNSYKLDVPLQVDIGLGENWDKAH